MVVVFGAAVVVVVDRLVIGNGVVCRVVAGEWVYTGRRVVGGVMVVVVVVGIAVVVSASGNRFRKGVTAGAVPSTLPSPAAMVEATVEVVVVVVVVVEVIVGASQTISLGLSW